MDKKNVHSRTNSTLKTPLTYGRDQLFAWIPAAIAPEINEMPGEMGKTNIYVIGITICLVGWFTKNKYSIAKTRRFF